MVSRVDRAIMNIASGTAPAARLRGTHYGSDPRRASGRRSLPTLVDINETYLSGVERGKRNQLSPCFNTSPRRLG
jgi:hypothetical protein